MNRFLCVVVMAYSVAWSGVAVADPAPYPLTVNSRAARAPDASAFRAAEKTFRVSFVDGSTVSSITNQTPFMSWSTNATSSVVSTAAVTVVSAVSGIVDFAFSPASVNYAPGTYIYEVGVLNGSTPRVYQQGTFIIQGSPYATGADPVTWTTNWNLGTVTLTGPVPVANLSGITSQQMATATDTAYRNAPAYGNLYLAEASAKAYATAGTYYKITGWTAGRSYGSTLTTSNITTATAGDYLITFTGYVVPTATHPDNFSLKVYTNNAASRIFGVDNFWNLGGSTGHGYAMSGVLALPVGCKVDLRGTMDNDNGITNRFYGANLIIEKLR